MKYGNSAGYFHKAVVTRPTFFVLAIILRTCKLRVQCFVVSLSSKQVCYNCSYNSYSFFSIKNAIFVATSCTCGLGQQW